MKIMDGAPPLDPELVKYLLKCLDNMPVNERLDQIRQSIGLLLKVLSLCLNLRDKNYVARSECGKGPTVK